MWRFFSTLNFELDLDCDRKDLILHPSNCKTILAFCIEGLLTVSAAIQRSFLAPIRLTEQQFHQLPYTRIGELLRRCPRIGQGKLTVDYGSIETPCKGKLQLC